jgi:hypothetical protein
MTATAINKLNSAQTYSRLWPMLPPCVVMATSFQDTLAVASKHIRLTNKKNNDLDQFVQMDRAPSGHVEISLKRDIVSPTQCFGENRHLPSSLARGKRPPERERPELLFPSLHDNESQPT